ncbi:hypothetical protein [Gemmata sp.]|uniref:hypothetical protein n=1 Tax=Gemmata sp. TaxID=1914242 RepID=UPI003F6F5499
MSVTINDPAAVSTLASVTGVEVEIRGPDGQLLGRFTPAPRPGMSFPELGVTDEEMERRLNDPNAKWVTGDEVMARLRSLRGTH